MRGYVVRLRDRADFANARDLVGVYFAANPEELANLVDECCDAGACEYAKLGAGGVYCAGRAIPVPYGEMAESETIEMLPGAAVTDSWWETFLGDEEGVWYPLERPAYAQVLVDHGLCP